MNKELQPALRQPLVSGCLFRAIKDDMSNPCWLKGTLHIRNDSFGKVYTIEYEAGEYIYNQNSVIPSTIGQNTGLLDKLGREIFEGDTVRWENVNVTGVIEWEKQAGAFWLKWKIYNENRYKDMHANFSDGDEYRIDYFEVLVDGKPDLFTAGGQEKINS